MGLVASLAKKLAPSFQRLSGSGVDETTPTPLPLTATLQILEMDFRTLPLMALTKTWLSRMPPSTMTS